LLSVDESLLSRLEKVLKSDRKKHDWSLELTSDEQSEIEKGIKEGGIIMSLLAMMK
jgi:hypothetical protein